jgi:hypothetical protein
MIWMTWRQHRSEALVAGLLVAAFAALVLATGLPAHDAFSDRGLDACRGRPSPGDECVALVTRFQSEFGHPNSWYADVGMSLLPLLIGMFVGAPLLAREFEQGTWQLAWSQAIPRLRWLVVKLAFVLATVAVVAAAVSGLWMWWHQPHDRFGTRLGDYFNYAWPVFVTYTVFAVVLGVTAGRLIRRTLPAMAVVLLLYIGVRIPFEVMVRENLLEPATSVVPFGEPTPRPTRRATTSSPTTPWTATAIRSATRSSWRSSPKPARTPAQRPVLLKAGPPTSTSGNTVCATRSRTTPPARSGPSSSPKQASS